MRAILLIVFALAFGAPAAAQVAVNPITNKVYVANEFANTVTVLDGATGATVTIPVGNRPQYIALNPLTNRIFVNNAADASLSVIDGATRAVTTHPIGSTGPISINPVTGKVYIVRLSSEAFDEVTIFDDAASNWYSIATQSFQPVGMALNPVTNTLYVAHYANGHIRAIDGSSTSDHPPSVEIRIFDSAVAVAVNPVTNRIYALTEDPRSAITVINGVTNEPTFLTPPGHAVGPKAVAVNPVTNKIYAAFNGEVVVIDGATNALTFIPSGTSTGGPVAVGIDLSTNKIYAPNANGTMTVINAAANTVTTVPIHAGATGVAVNPVTGKVYVAGGGSTTVYNGEDTRRDVPIDTQIEPLPGNSTGSSATLTVRASTSFTPTNTGVLKVYYQLDGTTGPWLPAAGSGPYTVQLTGLSGGSHMLRAFAVDAQAAPSVNSHPQSMPLIGDIASYTFTSGSTEAPASLSFSSASYDAAEGNPPPAIRVNRTGGSTNAVSVRWTTANGSAQAGSDFGTAGNATQYFGTLNWAAGDTEPKAISIPILDDAASEAAEAFTLALSLPTGGATLGSISSATVNVADNDTSSQPTRLRFGAPGVTVSERGANVTLEVVREGPSSAPASVSFTTSNGTAVAPGDYTTTSGVISFPAGVTSKQITIGRLAAAAPYVRVVTDALNEGNETFTLTLGSPSGGELGTPSSATVTIAADSALPTNVQFSASASAVSEGAGSTTVSVVRSGDSTGAVSVAWSTANGTAIAGTDFGVAGVPEQQAGTVAWAAGDSGVKTLVIPILNNELAESAKVFTVSLSAPTGATLGTNSTARVTINDNDQGLAFDKASYSTAENAPTVTLRVNRTGAASASARVTWAAVNGTAVAGRDFGTQGSAVAPTGSLYWGVGDSSPKTLAIRILNDAISEGDLGFTVELRSPVGATLATSATASVTIVDDDIPPESAFSFDQRKVLVLESGGEAIVSVTRSALPGGSFSRAASVNYTTLAGTALAGADFTARSGTLTWSAGESGSKPISIPITNDTNAEPPEAFKVTLSGPSSGAGITTPGNVVLIVDDDEVFPPQGAMPSDWRVPASAAAGWFVSNEAGAYEGAFSLRSEAIGDNESAQVEVAGNFAAGTVSFRVRVSSEADFDFVRFYVDGVMVREWSGMAVTGWQLFSTPLAAGAHALRWSYEKDGSASLGEDAAWIDAVTLPVRTP